VLERKISNSIRHMIRSNKRLDGKTCCACRRRPTRTRRCRARDAKRHSRIEHLDGAPAQQRKLRHVGGLKMICKMTTQAAGNGFQGGGEVFWSFWNLDAGCIQSTGCITYNSSPYEQADERVMVSTHVTALAAMDSLPVRLKGPKIHSSRIFF